MENKYHFIIDDGCISAYNGNDGFTPIAKIVNARSCLSLIRHSNITEDITLLFDDLLAKEAEQRQAFSTNVESNQNSENCGMEDQIGHLLKVNADYIIELEQRVKELNEFQVTLLLRIKELMKRNKELEDMAYGWNPATSRFHNDPAD